MTTDYKVDNILEIIRYLGISNMDYMYTLSNDRSMLYIKAWNDCNTHVYILDVLTTDVITKITVPSIMCTIECLPPTHGSLKLLYDGETDIVPVSSACMSRSITLSNNQYTVLANNDIKALVIILFNTDNTSVLYEHKRNGYIIQDMIDINDNYVDMNTLYRICISASLPCEIPIPLNSNDMHILNVYRDFINIDLLEHFFKDLHVDTHRANINGDIVYGIQVNDKRITTWPYKMSTICPSSDTFERDVEDEIKKWCLIDPCSESLDYKQRHIKKMQLERICRWLPYKVKVMTTPRNNRRNAALYAIDTFNQCLSALQWDIYKLNVDAPYRPEVALDTTIPKDKILVVPVGIPGIGKSTTLRALHCALEDNNIRSYYDTQDNYKGNAKKFFKTLKNALQCNDIVIADRNNYTERQRNDVINNVIDDRLSIRIIYINFIPCDVDISKIVSLAIERQRQRGIVTNSTLTDPSIGSMVIKRFAKEFEPVCDNVELIELNPLDSIKHNTCLILKALGIEVDTLDNYVDKSLECEDAARKESFPHTDIAKLCNDSVVLIRDILDRENIEHDINDLHVKLIDYENIDDKVKEREFFDCKLGHAIKIQLDMLVYDDDAVAILVNVGRDYASYIDGGHMLHVAIKGDADKLLHKNCELISSLRLNEFVVGIVSRV